MMLLPISFIINKRFKFPSFLLNLKEFSKIRLNYYFNFTNKYLLKKVAILKI